jgi:uncharacterized protein (DUF924 family)
MDIEPAAVTEFWTAAGEHRWYAKDDAFDAEVRSCFLEAHEAAARGELWAWEADAEGALALILLLDQVPRNVYRGSAHTFATDGAALLVAERAIARGFDGARADKLRQFFYLPLMHAENLEAQQRCVALFEALRPAFAESLKYAKEHCDIIARFGRFPHRNHVLGRHTTPQEQAYLDSGGFAG